MLPFFPTYLLMAATAPLLPLLAPWKEKLVSGYCALKKVNRNFHRKGVPKIPKRSTKIFIVFPKKVNKNALGTDISP